MSKINFVIGLTDVEDYDGFVYDTTLNENQPNNVRYNIQRADTSIEKDKITWSLDLSLAATTNMLKVWEHIIRRPHLSLIDINLGPSLLLPTHKDYELSVNFLNLIPILPDYKISLTDTDYAKFTEYENFGDMYIDLSMLYDANTINWKNSLQSAYGRRVIDDLEERVSVNVVPRFVFSFTLKQRPFFNKEERSVDFSNWLTDNTELLAKKGYAIDEPYCNIGRLCIGKLIGDPWEEYQKLQKYSRICRTSMVTVEE
jgi:hypothetical protein